jgi:hypothetical protein
MKKLFVLAIVALVAVGSVFAEGNAGNALGGDSLLLTANVGYRLYATLDGDITFDVNAFGAEAANQDNEASLNIVSNRKTWTVQLSSSNSGVLQSSGLADIPYKVQLTLATTGWTGAGAVTGAVLTDLASLSSPKSIVAAGGDSRTTNNGVNYTLAVVADTPATGVLYEEGVYTDTITVTISAS